LIFVKFYSHLSKSIL